MSYGCVIVARKPEDVHLKFDCPTEVVTGPMSLNEARNIGASRLKTDYIAFIDDDNELNESALEAMSSALDSHEEIAVVSPLIWDNRGRVWFEGGRINALGRFEKFHNGSTEVFHDVFMVRRSAFEEVGGLDSKSFPFFLGEADLGERLKRTGYWLTLRGNAVVIHNIEGRSITRISHIRTPQRAYYVARNQLIFVKKYRHLSLYLLTYFPVRTLAHLSGILMEKKWGFVKPYLKGIWDGLRWR